MAIRKSFLEDTIFDPINLNKYSTYLLGLLWADGFLSKTKNDFTIAIEAQKDDINSIQEVFVNTGIWMTYERQRNKKWKIMNKKYLSNKIVWTYLFNNDYTYKSCSPCKILQTIPENLKYYWFRGYFDGDGTIGKYTRSRNLGFTSCKDQDWKFLINLYNQLNITNYFSITEKYKNGSSSKIRLCRKDEISKFLKFIYPNGYDFGFKRKYNKFIEIL